MEPRPRRLTKIKHSQCTWCGTLNAYSVHPNPEMPTKATGGFVCACGRLSTVTLIDIGLSNFSYWLETEIACSHIEIESIKKRLNINFNEEEPSG